MRLPTPQLKLWQELLLVTLVLGGLILLLLNYFGNQSRKEYSTTLISQTAESAARDFVNHFQPINTNLEIILKWGVSELPTPEKIKNLDAPMLNARLIPIIESLPARSPFHLATSDGKEYLLSPSDNGWLTRTSDVVQWGNKQKWQRWSASGEKIEEWWQEQVYDPRSEPWYKLASSTNQGIAWTKPYRSSVDQKLTLTGAIHWQQNGEKNTTYVAAFDIPLTVFYQTAALLKTTDNGISFVMTDAAKVLKPTPGDPDAAASAAGIGPLELSQIDNPVIAKAVELWDPTAMSPNEPFPFQFNGQSWWAGFNPIIINDTSKLWIGTLIPESDFLGNINQRRGAVIAVVVLLGGLGALIAYFVIRRDSRRQNRILDSTELQMQLASIIQQGEGYRQEFKSTMRQNLRENKPDKGIELAWLKTVVGFLNSAGGLLLIGVGDDGEPLGLDADNFANEDKTQLHFKNLVNQHIGLEYSRYIHLDLIDYQGKQIAVIQCEKAATPVFLKVKNDEEFHIRSGPSTTKLTGSKLLQYLGHKPAKKNI